MRKSPKFSPEVVERAVRMVLEAKDQYPSQWAAIESIAGKIGCTAETLRRWVRQAERDQGLRQGPTTADQQRVKMESLMAQDQQRVKAYQLKKDQKNMDALGITLFNLKA